jgi:3-deoxy-7-phosphoheptulonate synthase
MTWSPTSWQNKLLEQQADYPDPAALEQVIAELSQLPPLVSAQEVTRLKELNARAAQGEVFLLQGGDCAETFADCKPDAIHRKVQLLLQMSLLLTYGLGKPIVRVGRMAGQYAKPRSAHTETLNGVSLPCYRGDLINDVQFNLQQRTPDPARLLKGYSLASLTLNYIRTIDHDAFQKFCSAEYWNAEQLFGKDASPFIRAQLQDVSRAFTLIQHFTPKHWLRQLDFYTCHEALHLHYEQALTRKIEGQWFNLSTHMPWVGMRTAKPNSGHIEYLRGIENPVAIKVGPRMSREWLIALCRELNPDNNPGRITLITRLGHQNVSQRLPQLIDAIQQANLSVTWCCDPMHGNTQITPQGVKTRHFSDIVSELDQTMTIHAQHQSILGGVHLELTGEAVTECMGGHCAIQEKDLQRAYHSLVDPRLNHNQALELTLHLIESYKKQHVNNPTSPFSDNLLAHPN